VRRFLVEQGATGEDGLGRMQAWGYDDKNTSSHPRPRLTGRSRFRLRPLVATDRSQAVDVQDIVRFPVHLGLGARAVVEPEFTGAVEWYAGYESRHGADGAEGRLVSMHTFSAPWPMWEMHPHGSEVVLCTGGAITVHQELPDGSRSSAVLGPGQYVVNPPGAWHTAVVDAQATVLFITAGLGTRHRPR
jgi:quercetin dioxygenase-like cupin family protein